MQNFMSDNIWGVHPQIMKALKDAALGADKAYGDDRYTAWLYDMMEHIFGRAVACLPVQSGTGANGLALSLCAGPIHRVLCHKEAHLWESECGAIENYTGGAALEFVEGEHGKISSIALEETLSRDSHDFHRQEPSVVSISQPTEVGTIYTPDEVRSLSHICKKYDLYLHMDGARLANAAAVYKNMSLKELTCDLGVDVLSLGFTKNGAMGAEAVLVFDNRLSKELKYRAKRGGLIAPKMRFVSIQILTMLQDDLWRQLGLVANQKAKMLYDGLIHHSCVEVNTPFESNQLFVDLEPQFTKFLQKKGVLFYKWPSLGHHCCRFICSWETDDREINRFVEIIKEFAI